MGELSGNITMFNSYVNNIELSLVSNGQHSDKLLLNILLANDVVKDDDFVSYIKSKNTEKFIHFGVSWLIVECGEPL
jgi:hypothetical protein